MKGNLRGFERNWAVREKPLDTVVTWPHGDGMTPVKTFKLQGVAYAELSEGDDRVSVAVEVCSVLQDMRTTGEVPPKPKGPKE